MENSVLENRRIANEEIDNNSFWKICYYYLYILLYGLYMDNIYIIIIYMYI